MEPSFDAVWEREQEGLEVFETLDKRVREDLVELTYDRLLFIVVELSECESPIEELLGLHMLCLAPDLVDRGCFVLNPQRGIDTCIGRLRVDFCVDAKIDGQIVTLVVECDGHEFHEKTRTQAARDKRRDRALKLAGYDVIHFTGSEIWKDPRACAMEVFRQLQALADKRQGV